MRTTPLDEMSPEQAAETKKSFLEAFARLCFEHGFDHHLTVTTEPVRTGGHAMILSLNFTDARGDGDVSTIYDVRSGWGYKGFTVTAKLDRTGVESFSCDLTGGGT